MMGSPTESQSRSPVRPPARKNFAVLVLGDVGRSPRMQYHAVSLANIPGNPSRCFAISLRAAPTILNVLRGQVLWYR